MCRARLCSKFALPRCKLRAHQLIDMLAWHCMSAHLKLVVRGRQVPLVAVPVKQVGAAAERGCGA